MDRVLIVDLYLDLVLGAFSFGEAYEYYTPTQNRNGTPVLDWNVANLVHF